MAFQLARRQLFQAAAGINTTFCVTQGTFADVRRKNFDIPCLRKHKRIRDSDRDGIWFLARGATRAPDAQSARRLPKLLHMQFREHFLLESFVNSGIAEKRGFLSEQTLDECVVFDSRSVELPQQVSAASEMFRTYVFAHARREEALARGVE